MVRSDATADDSFAAIRARNRFGMAIAAMIKMIATTISNSISEKPFCFFKCVTPPQGGPDLTTMTVTQFAFERPPFPKGNQSKPSLQAADSKRRRPRWLHLRGYFLLAVDFSDND